MRRNALIVDDQADTRKLIKVIMLLDTVDRMVATS
jgi:hypothetical protein